MRDTQALVVNTLPTTVDNLCQTFGVWATARALIAAAWRQHRTTGQISQLSNRQRRDIGLPEKHDVLLDAFWDIKPPSF
ncbi:DUF1127 domain-containing protein [Sinorhizobium meliloti]|uniref:DUF1127 domain-containing protein n=1 Tax=Rhizobium meliloti TaxID=382 RepID=UPI003F18B322